MKKLFSVLAIAALVSCNNGDEAKTEEVKADTTVAPAPTPAPVDTTATAAPADTTAAAK